MIDKTDKYNSDPTYEAWKRLKSYWALEGTEYSDPTYEAWKRSFAYSKESVPNANSDPTYEAWKLGMNGAIVIA